MRRGFILICLLIATVLIVGCTSSAKVEDKGAVPVQKNIPTTEAKANSAKSTDGQVGNTYEVNYLNDRYEVQLQKTAFETSTFQGETYLMAFFEIRNVGDKEVLLAPDIYALDSSSEKYDKTIAIGVSDPEYSKNLDFFKKLAPGTKMSGWVAIKVSSPDQKYSLFFQYSNQFIDKTPLFIKYAIG